MYSNSKCNKRESEKVSSLILKRGRRLPLSSLQQEDSNEHWALSPTKQGMQDTHLGFKVKVGGRVFRKHL
jgi:hypothetical protein